MGFFRLNIYEESQFVTLLVTVNLFLEFVIFLNENTNIKFKRSSPYILVVNNTNLASYVFTKRCDWYLRDSIVFTFARGLWIKG